MPSTRIKKVLDHSAKSLAALLTKLEVHNKALSASKKALPSYLSEHCLHCVVRDNRLILFTDTASWSSQLRFCAPVILQAVNASLPGRYDTLQVRVTLTGTTTPDTAHRPRRPSRETVGQIRENAQHIADDRLKRSLVRLSQALESR